MLFRSVKTFVDTLRAQGRLPVGAFGEIEFETNRVQTEALLEELMMVCGKPNEDIEVNITSSVLGEDKKVHLSGWLTQHYQSGLIRYRSGRIRPADYLSAWIDHLCMSAMDVAKRTHMIGYEGKEGVVHFIFPAIDNAEHASKTLDELIELFYEGMTAPLPYFPRTSFESVKACIGKAGWVDDEEKSLKAMEGKFNDGYMMEGEGRNAYIARIWPTWNEELARKARDLAARVIQVPLMSVVQSGDE